jgi:DNA mismatch repair protein MutS
MAQLSAKLDGVDNATVSVKEWDDDIVFLHEVKKGTADRSYGVQVARLAGLPEVVVDRATVVLEALEKGECDGSQKAVIDDLPLFSATPAPIAKTPEASQVEDALRDVLPDELTPKDALALVYKLRDMIRD